jgi:hypothetical protein
VIDVAVPYFLGKRVRIKITYEVFVTHSLNEKIDGGIANIGEDGDGLGHNII